MNSDSCDTFASDLLLQQENMITSIAEWRTNIYNIMQLAHWKKQHSPCIQNDIAVIQRALTDPNNADIYTFAVEQVQQMLSLKSYFEKSIFQTYRGLITNSSNSISFNLKVDLDQKTQTLINYFSQPNHAYEVHLQQQYQQQQQQQQLQQQQQQQQQQHLLQTQLSVSSQFSSPSKVDNPFEQNETILTRESSYSQASSSSMNLPCEYSPMISQIVIESEELDFQMLPEETDAATHQ